MTPALLAVIGPTEIVLIVIGVVLMLGIPTVGAVILWRLVKREQDCRRGLS